MGRIGESDDETGTPISRRAPPPALAPPPRPTSPEVAARVNGALAASEAQADVSTRKRELPAAPQTAATKPTGAAVKKPKKEQPGTQISILRFMQPQPAAIETTAAATMAAVTTAPTLPQPAPTLPDPPLPAPPMHAPALAQAPVALGSGRGGAPRTVAPRAAVHAAAGSTPQFTVASKLEEMTTKTATACDLRETAEEQCAADGGASLVLGALLAAGLPGEMNTLLNASSAERAHQLAKVCGLYDAVNRRLNGAPGLRIGVDISLPRAVSSGKIILLVGQCPKVGELEKTLYGATLGLVVRGVVGAHGWSVRQVQLGPTQHAWAVEDTSTGEDPTVLATFVCINVIPGPNGPDAGPHPTVRIIGATDAVSRDVSLAHVGATVASLEAEGATVCAFVSLCDYADEVLAGAVVQPDAARVLGGRSLLHLGALADLLQGLSSQHASVTLMRGPYPPSLTKPTWASSVLMRAAREELLHQLSGMSSLKFLPRLVEGGRPGALLSGAASGSGVYALCDAVDGALCVATACPPLDGSALLRSVESIWSLSTSVAPEVGVDLSAIYAYGTLPGVIAAALFDELPQGVGVPPLRRATAMARQNAAFRHLGAQDAVAADRDQNLSCLTYADALNEGSALASVPRKDNEAKQDAQRQVELRVRRGETPSSATVGMCATALLAGRWGPFAAIHSKGKYVQVPGGDFVLVDDVELELVRVDRTVEVRFCPRKGVGAGGVTRSDAINIIIRLLENTPVAVLGDTPTATSPELRGIWVPAHLLDQPTPYHGLRLGFGTEESRAGSEGKLLKRLHAFFRQVPLMALERQRDLLELILQLFTAFVGDGQAHTGGIATSGDPKDPESNAAGIMKLLERIGGFLGGKPVAERSRSDGHYYIIVLKDGEHRVLQQFLEGQGFIIKVPGGNDRRGFPTDVFQEMIDAPDRYIIPMIAGLVATEGSWMGTEGVDKHGYCFYQAVVTNHGDGGRFSQHVSVMDLAVVLGLRAGACGLPTCNGGDFSARMRVDFCGLPTEALSSALEEICPGKARPVEYSSMPRVPTFPPLQVKPAQLAQAAEPTSQYTVVARLLDKDKQVIPTVNLYNGLAVSQVERTPGSLVEEAARSTTFCNLQVYANEWAAKLNAVNAGLEPFSLVAVLGGAEGYPKVHGKQQDPIGTTDQAMRYYFNPRVCRGARLDITRRLLLPEAAPGAGPRLLWDEVTALIDRFGGPAGLVDTQTTAMKFPLGGGRWVVLDKKQNASNRATRGQTLVIYMFKRGALAEIVKWADLVGPAAVMMVLVGVLQERGVSEQVMERFMGAGSVRGAIKVYLCPTKEEFKETKSNLRYLSEIKTHAAQLQAAKRPSLLFQLNVPQEGA